MSEDIAYIRTINHSVNLAEGLFNAAKSSSPAPPKSDFKIVTTNDLLQQYDAQPLIPWGANNRFPFELDAAAQKVGVLRTGLKRLVEYAYNQGIFHYKVLEEDSATGVQKVKILHEPAVEEFFRATRINQYIVNAFRNYFRYGIVFAVYLLDASRKVSQLRVYDSREARLERPHPETGLIENVYISKFWNTGMMLSSTTIPKGQEGMILKYPMLDEFNMTDQLKYHETDFTFIQRIRNAMTGEEYGEAEWHSVYFNKWLNISASVPLLKERLFTYAMTLNYIIYIDDEYWEFVFGKETWLGWNSEQRMEKVKELQDAIESDLGGKNNAFKTILAGISYSVDGKPQKQVIIETIDNKLREGTFIPDNLHANGEILAALGVDACLLGATVLGDKISSGSGSNIREAALNLIATLRIHRDLVIEPLSVVQQINGWDPEIKFGFKDYIIGTQDGRPPVNGNENKPA